MSLESIFTPPGTNDRRDQDNRNTAVAAKANDTLDLVLPGVKKQIEFGNSLEPVRQNAINKTLMLATPGTQTALAEKKVGVIGQGLQDSIKNIVQQFKSNGLSAGATAGAIGDLTNSATEQSNEARTAMMDPEKRAQLQQLILQITQQGQKVDVNTMNALAGLIYSQPQTQVGQGIGSVVGGALGSWAAGGFKS